MDGVSPLKPTTNYAPLLTNAVPVGVPGPSANGLSPSIAGSCSLAAPLHFAAALHSAVVSAYHLPGQVAVCLRAPDTCLQPVFASVLQHMLHPQSSTSQPAQQIMCCPAGVGDLLQAQAQLPQNLQLPATPKMPEWFSSRPFLTGTNLFEAAGSLKTLKQRGTRPPQELGTFSRPVQELVGEAAIATAPGTAA